MHLNVALAKAYAHELTKLAKELKLAGPVTLDQLVRAPGVFQTDEELAETGGFVARGGQGVARRLGRAASPCANAKARIWPRTLQPASA